ncbi:MAG: cytochrome ubiquinol oxidase subunit I [Nitrospinota bacterium]
MDFELLSRLQFAFTISFHYIYPPLSIGLGVVLVVMKGMYIRTGNIVYDQMTRFWIKIFALIFGIGVATGIVMEFEFGTNWAAYSRYVGDIFGSALAAEGIFAFALESGFLGVLIFGQKRVSPKMHFFAVIMVAFGSMFSAVWIVVANSWMQTPAGFHIVGEGLQARAEVVDFWAMVFNPSSIERLLHVICGGLLSGAFFVLSVNAYYIIKGRYLEIAKPAFKIALVIATVSSLFQLFSGHLSADGVARNQPAKLAAFEGHFDRNAPGALYLAGWVDNEKQEVTGIKIPGGLSFLIHQDFKAPIPGLKAFSVEDKPSMVNFLFQTYHMRVGIGMILITLALLAVFLWWRGKLFDNTLVLHLFVWAVLLPQVANQLGWYAAEVGRQPWLVYGLLKTADGLSENVSSSEVLFSLLLFTAIYTLLFGLFIYLLNKKIQRGPYVPELIDHRPKQAEIAGNL